MLRFLFGGRKEAKVKIESQRETFERLVSELNAAIDALPDKPKVTVDPATGHILPEAPEQFPDEALALPGPSKDEKPAEQTAPAEAAKDANGHETSTAGGGALPPETAPGNEAEKPQRTAPEAKVLPGTPVPNPPQRASH